VEQPVAGRRYGNSWARSPTRICGTSSILGGWWVEGYNGADGWAFGGEDVQGDRRQADAEALYRLLEEKIIPLYYQRSDDEVPHGFVQVMKASIKSVAPIFSTRRMVQEYVERSYVQALGGECQ
jgi:starch phosphorylase